MQSRTTILSRLRPPLLAAAVALGLATLSGAQPASAQEFVIKFGNQTQNDVQHEYMKQFKAKLEKATNNRVRVDLFPAAQLGPFPRMLEGVRLGNIELLVAPSEFFVGADPRFQVPAMPGLYKDYDHARRVFDKPEARQLIGQMSDSRGLITIGYTVYDFQMFDFKQPATKLADFKGRRVRVLASEVEQAVVQGLGAASVPMPLPEVLPALQQGTVDGVTTALGIFVSLRYYDAAPYLLETKLWALMPLIVASKTWFNKLPPDIQAAVKDAGSSIEPEMHAWQAARIKADYESWTKNGGKLAKLSADEQAQAEKAASTALQGVLAKNASMKEFYDKLKAIAAATK